MQIVPYLFRPRPREIRKQWLGQQQFLYAAIHIERSFGWGHSESVETGFTEGLNEMELIYLWTSKEAIQPCTIQHVMFILTWFHSILLCSFRKITLQLEKNN